MTRIFNRAEEKPKRRALRNEMTKAERIIWSRLSRRQIENARFLRQYGVEHFVMDFYCPELKLAIEIDGETHFTPEAQAYDAMRQARIEQYGIRFLRFTNAEVYGQLGGVIEKIRATVKALRASS
ncbi:MAG: endonuclease domain-containing protein [Chloroherpetonaceae bacterium]|nr:endonuclease domain-containing protein [Chloroherpetonaceae bacterium]